MSLIINNFLQEKEETKMTTERVENMAGGQGHALIKRLLDEKQLNGKCRLYADVTLEPGCSL